MTGCWSGEVGATMSVLIRVIILVLKLASGRVERLSPGSFFTLLLGMVVSFLVLALELCCAKGKGKEFGDTPVKTFTP